MIMINESDTTASALDKMLACTYHSVRNPILCTLPDCPTSPYKNGNDRHPKHNINQRNSYVDPPHFCSVERALRSFVCHGPARRKRSQQGNYQSGRLQERDGKPPDISRQSLAFHRFFF